jgi:exopolysaccharide biosynthesis polyprenyl glycosylphosphotransferase
MIRRHGFGFRALLMGADASLAIVLLAIVSVLRFGDEWLTHWKPIIAQPILLAVAYAVAWVAILWLHGLYRARARWTLRAEGIAIAWAVVVMALVTLSVLFAFRLPDISRTYLALLFPAQWVVTVASRAVMRFAFERMRSRGLNQRFILVVGAGPSGQDFAAKVEAHAQLGLRVLGFVDDIRDELPPQWKLLGSLDSIERLLHSEVIDEVAICLPFTEWNRMNAIAHLCEEEGKIVRVPMDLLEHAFAAGRVEDFDGTPVYSLVMGPDRMLALVLKRAIDILVAGAGLIIASPVLALVALAVRFREGSPVLFRQERVGLHGRRFDVLKFRTMVPDAEARYDEVVGLSDPRAFKVTDDPRITPIGRFLRKTSLDELPQLWNVLRGEMSLVGPRPAPPREVDEYDLWHRRRLSMKPGITGLWQVSARHSDDFDGRAQLDLSYIDRWSLLLDFKILVRTPSAAFRGR